MGQTQAMNAGERTLSETVETGTVCYHCGVECAPEQFVEDDKAFCCAGCQTVYRILNEHDMCQYYDIEPSPGTQLKGKIQQRYEFLELPAVVEELVDYNDGTTAVVRFFLSQIHCASCIWLLENLHKFNPGIAHAQVNFMRKELKLRFNPDEISLRQVVELLDSIGYAPEIELNHKANRAQKTDRSLSYQLGIAGFAFGNIMLLSFPEYLGLSSSESVYFQLFGYLNIALSLPVLLYSGRPYWMSAWQAVKHGTVNMDVPITLGMLALFFRSSYEILSHTGAGYMDSLAGLVFFLLIGKWFQQRTFDSLSFERDYNAYFPIAATRLDGNAEQSVQIGQLKPGDRVLIRFGELIPADGVLMSGNALIDYSFVTGESTPVHKHAGDKIFAGGRQTGESFEMELTKPSSQSYLTNLWSNEAFQTDEYRKVEKFADKAGKYFTAVVLVIAFATLLYWWPIDIAVAMQAFSAVLIIACPCAIALSIPFTYGNILRILARRSFFIKHTVVIEAIQSITHMVFDKTGTLTAADRSAVSFHPYEGRHLSDREKSLLRSLAFQSSHPASRIIAGYFATHPLQKLAELNECIGKGLSGIAEGVKVLLGSNSYMQECGIDLPPDLPPGTCLAIDGQYRGQFSFENEYRSGFGNTVKTLARSYKISVISGDNDRERALLERAFPDKNRLLFEQSPEDKLAYIRQLQNAGDKVMMIGDGLNDAGGLRQSNVGVVITESVNNFTPASDVIMAADNFQDLPVIMHFLKNAKKLIYWAYGLAFIYNLIGLSYAVTGSLSPLIAAVLMPLSSITIVAFGVLASNYFSRIYGLK